MFASSRRPSIPALLHTRHESCAVSLQHWQYGIDVPMSCWAYHEGRESHAEENGQCSFAREGAAYGQAAYWDPELDVVSIAFEGERYGYDVRGASCDESAFDKHVRFAGITAEKWDFGGGRVEALFAGAEISCLR